MADLRQKTGDEHRGNVWENLYDPDGNDFMEEKEILIEVESIENIDATKVKEVAVKVAFKDQAVIETGNLPVTDIGECDVNVSGVISVQPSSLSVIDDLLANPIFITVIDCTGNVKQEKEITYDVKKDSKKESKKATSRASLSVKSAVRSSHAVTSSKVLGMCNMDLGSLVKGQKVAKERMLVELEKSGSGRSIISWPKLPRMVVRASTGDKEIIPPQVNRLNNIINVTVESVYNVPNDIEEGTSFEAHISVPCFEDKMETLTFTNGTLVNMKESECLKRWSTLSQVDGRAAFSKHKINPDPCDIINPDNEVANLWKAVRGNGRRIQWNKWRSSIMVKTASNFFFQKLVRHKLWPLEIAAAAAARPVSQKVGKGENKAKTASLPPPATAERYVAYLRLGSLLYPGVTRARVASRLYTYSPSDIAEKCGSEFIMQPEKSDINKMKTSDKVKSNGKETEENKDGCGKPVFNESGDPVFVVVEFEVWKAYLPRREPEHLFKRFSSYFPPRGQISNKQMTLTLARKNYSELVEKLSLTINELYRSFVVDGKKKDPPLPTIEDNFLHHLCNEGILQKLKMTLEEKMVTLVGEAYGVMGKQKENAPDIFVYLVDEANTIINSFITHKKRTLIGRQVEANDLQLSAEEAIEDGNYKLARRYLQQKVCVNKLNPDYWLDYALCLKAVGENEKATELVRETLSLDAEHQIGLLLYGLMLAKEQNMEIAELTFHVLLAKYPEFAEGWLILHLFYSTIGNLEAAEFTLHNAFKLDCDGRKERTSDANKSAEEETFLGDSSSYELQGRSEGFAEGKYGVTSFSKGKSTSDPLSWTVDLGTDSSLYIKTAILLLRLRSFELAEFALSREPPTEQGGQSMELLYYLAVSHYLREQYNEAIIHLQTAAENFGKNCYILGLIGHCYYKLQNYDNCIECYDYVIESYNRPNDIHLIYVRMGQYYLRSNKYKCAKKMFLCACKYSPSSETWLGLGISCYNLGEFEEAEEALTEANFLDDMCPVVWAYLTLVNIQLQRFAVFELCYAETKKKNLKDSRLMKQIEALMNVNNMKDPIFH